MLTQGPGEAGFDLGDEPIPRKDCRQILRVRMEAKQLLIGGL